MATEANETQAKKPAAKKAAEKKTAPAKEQATEKKPAATAEKTPATTRYTVTAPLLNIREKATLSSKILGTLGKGEQVEVSARTPQGFGKLTGREGYIALEYTKVLEGERP